MVIDSDLALLAELEPEAERLLERHLASSKDWHPHTMVPWSRGRDFEPGYEWSPDECDLPGPLRSALFINLLTEDNLPYYFRDIERMFGHDGAWGTWVRRWTAEEGRHATVHPGIPDRHPGHRSLQLEEARMVQISGGKVPEPPSAIDGLIYVSLQELATRISHRNTGLALQNHDRVGYDIMRKVAVDENHHFIFYRDMAKAALDLDPSAGVLAMERQIIGFTMPGDGIPNFNRHAKTIAAAGIYDLAVHYEQILEPVVLKYWNLPELTGLSPEAEAARERTLAHIAKSERVARRVADRKAAHAADDLVNA